MYFEYASRRSTNLGRVVSASEMPSKEIISEFGVLTFEELAVLAEGEGGDVGITTGSESVS
jgi:hypothetical protein